MGKTDEPLKEGGIITEGDLRKVFWRSFPLQGSFNYERMQNGGWCFSMIPAIKRLYPNKDDQIAALKRHMEFYNTHPYVSAPVMGVTLALEEDRANGAPVDDAAIQGAEWMRKYGHDGEYNWYFSTTRDGKPLAADVSYSDKELRIIFHLLSP